MADTFLVEHTGTLKQEAVTEEQFKAMQTIFPSMFRRVKGAAKADISKFSEKAKDIIKKSEDKKEAESEK